MEENPLTESDVGSFVKRRRRTNEMTQRELAELAGVGVRLISELERGKPTVRVDAVNRVLSVFGKQLGVIPLSRAIADND